MIDYLVVEPDLSMRLGDAIRPFQWVRIAYVFGSAARGDDRPGSDLDIGVLAARPVTVVELADLADALCRSSGREDVHLVELGGKSPGFLFQVIREGVLLLERDREERIRWQAEIMARWYDFAPTFELWRKAFREARRDDVRGREPSPR